MGFGLGDAFGLIANPGQYWGTNDLIGGAINDITGANNSSKRQFKNQLALQHDAQKFAKWQMENAHQTEVQDLQNAGLNPILSANAGASAGVTEGTAATGQTMADPIGMIGAIIGMMNSTKTTKALVNKTEAEAKNIDTNTKATEQTIEWTPELNRSLIKLQSAQSVKQYKSAEKDIQDNIESQARIIAIDIQAAAQKVDLKVREAFIKEEMAIKKQQMEAQLKAMGIKNSQIYQALDAAFESAGKVFHGNVSYSYGNVNTNSHSNVNVHNADYNPVRHNQIGF